MSQENVEAVRRGYEVAYPERSVENVLDAVDENFVWHQRPEWPGRLQYRMEDMPQLWADLDDIYTEFSIVPEEFAPVGEYVVVSVRTSARMRASDARVEGTCTTSGIFGTARREKRGPTAQGPRPSKPWGCGSRQAILALA